MIHTKLSLKILRDDPSEQVIWNQERPIAYLNRGDASVEEFVALENIIQGVPDLLKACQEMLDLLRGLELDDEIPETIAMATEAIRKVKG